VARPGLTEEHRVQDLSCSHHLGEGRLLVCGQLCQVGCELNRDEVDELGLEPPLRGRFLRCRCGEEPCPHEESVHARRYTG